MKKIKDLLPIGTIVKLKDATRPLMIYGVMQRNSEKPDIIYDYVGLPYPEGYLHEKLKFMFQQEDIEEVLFRGYEDPQHERLKFLATLEMLTELNEKRKAEARLKFLTTLEMLTEGNEKRKAEAEKKG